MPAGIRTVGPRKVFTTPSPISAGGPARGSRYAGKQKIKAMTADELSLEARPCGIPGLLGRASRRVSGFSGGTTIASFLLAFDAALISAGPLQYKRKAISQTA